ADPETPKKSDFVRAATSTNLIPDEDKTPRQSKRAGRASALAIIPDWNEHGQAREAVDRITSQYQEIGSVSPEMLHDFQQHVVPLSPSLSKAEANDADSVGFLLDSILREQAGSPQPRKSVTDYLSPNSYNPSDRTNMETPEEEIRGTAIVYSTTYRRSAASLPRASQDALNDTSYLQSFSPSSIMVNTPASQYDLGTPATEFVGSTTPALPDTTSGAINEDDDDDGYRPPPPPKDYGYSPRSSTGQLSMGDIDGHWAWTYHVQFFCGHHKTSASVAGTCTSTSTCECTRITIRGHSHRRFSWAYIHKSSGQPSLGALEDTRRTPQELFDACTPIDGINETRDGPLTSFTIDVLVPIVLCPTICRLWPAPFNDAPIS
ncbi:hypothetical protein KCU69_g21008, partial [Aureobasidium melanogenum]